MENEPRWDAQTLAEAEIIKSDPGRLSAAKEAAVKLAEEETAKAKAMKSIASGRTLGRRKNEVFIPGDLL